MRNLPRLLLLVSVFVSGLLAQPKHPLDGLATGEYWTVYDAIQKSGHLGADTYFASVLLKAPDKTAVLAWRPGEPIPRAADVILLDKGLTYEAVVDIAGKKLVSWQEKKGVQAPFLNSELMGGGEAIKKDPRVIEAFAKRGLTDLNTIHCYALPVSYAAVPEQETQRIGFSSCSEGRGSYHSWGQSIEGLTVQLDMVSKKVLKVVDTGAVPIGTGAVNYEEIPENARAGTTPILVSQPLGASYRIENGQVSWQNWSFRLRVDQRVGTVVNLVRFNDHGRERSVLYEASVSELYVPYMDPAAGWNNRVFIDGGEFYADGLLKPLRAGLDCPANATFFSGLMATEKGAPKLTSQLTCLFERASSDPSWRHGQGEDVFGRPSRELVLRSAAVIGNYDYIIDWRFLQDGTIDVAVGATGVIETKSTKEKSATGHTGHEAMPVEYGKFVADHTVGVNHDHFFSFRLDMDVDGPKNSFMAERLVQKLLPNDPMRKSIWVVQPSTAKTEKDAILDVSLDRPAMWMFVNPNEIGPLGYPTGYEIMPGATAKSLMSSDDLPQKLGAFSEHQMWVTPYDTNQRYASGVYPTASKATDGLANWTKANRPIENTDVVGWYTLGFHHVPRAEDWPVMPTMWHHFQIRPFHFFKSNPALDLPKAQ